MTDTHSIYFTNFTVVNLQKEKIQISKQFLQQPKKKPTNSKAMVHFRMFNHVR